MTKGGGRCATERAAIGKAKSGKARGHALKRFMDCKHHRTGKKGKDKKGKK